MPSSNLPWELQEYLLDVAESWLIDPNGPLAQVVDLVPPPRCYDVMNGLLYVGFARSSHEVERIEPIPVVTQILYADPPPADQAALFNLFVHVFAQVFCDWAQLHNSGGQYDVSR
jgi:hypothetical protein